MAREPLVPVGVVETPPQDIVLDYELALTTARQFVRFLHGAQHLEYLVILLTQREQFIQELDRRRVLAENALHQVEEQVSVVEEVYAEEQEKLSKQTQEAARRDQEWVKRREELTRLTLAAEDDLDEARHAHTLALAAQDAELRAIRAAFEQETVSLLERRHVQLQEVEQFHRLELAELTRQREEEGRRVAEFKSEMETMLARLLPLSAAAGQSTGSTGEDI